MSLLQFAITCTSPWTLWLVISIPRKRDLRQYQQYRRISHISHPFKSSRMDWTRLSQRKRRYSELIAASMCEAYRTSARSLLCPHRFPEGFRHGMACNTKGNHEEGQHQSDACQTHSAAVWHVQECSWHQWKLCGLAQNYCLSQKRLFFVTCSL